jgi:hypothetical protein
MYGYGITLQAPPPKRTRTITRPPDDISTRPTPGVVTLRRTISLPSDFPDVTSPYFSPGTGPDSSFSVPPSGYLPPAFTPPEGSTRSFPAPERSPFTPSGSSTVPTFDPSRRSLTPSFPTPLVSGSLPSYPAPGGRRGPRRSFWDFFRPAPRYAPYPQYPQQHPYYMPLAPGGELYAAGVFGPGMDAVAEMPTTTAPVVEEAPAATTSPWLLLAGLAAAGFVAYRYLGKRRAAPGAA